MHKAILALHSPMLKSMFESNLAEGRAMITYSRLAVNVLIDYLYGPGAALDSTCTDLNLAKEVVEMADCYQSGY